ncbi:hypothetical protein SmJEL517_g00088 [Synchytrium microbalum]|uniref:SUN domain-containing protein n=1 Tax=Synchytrium microbalum TaxID=1806994 RepID=A0A507CJW2_9FUNG|nr:uncharacterized protein SmJEL517_g00088 [Synchytrium microbalum]TPX38073.1 hypothetical protein SmJEL517_g00088 [Synchytrium microbalum]
MSDDPNIRKSNRKRLDVDYKKANEGLPIDATPTKQPKQRKNVGEASTASKKKKSTSNDDESFFTPATTAKKRSARLQGKAASDDFETLQPSPDPTKQDLLNNSEHHFQQGDDDDDVDGNDENLGQPKSIYNRAKDLILSPFKLFSGSNNANLADQSMMKLVDTDDFEDDEGGLLPEGGEEDEGASTANDDGNEDEDLTATSTPTGGEDWSLGGLLGKITNHNHNHKTFDEFLDNPDDNADDTASRVTDLEDTDGTQTPTDSQQQQGEQNGGTAKGLRRVRFAASDDQQEDDESQELRASRRIQDEEEDDEPEKEAEKEAETRADSTGHIETTTWSEWFHDQRLVVLLTPIVSKAWALVKVLIMIPWFLLDWGFIKPATFFGKPALSYISTIRIPRIYIILPLATILSCSALYYAAPNILTMVGLPSLSSYTGGSSKLYTNDAASAALNKRLTAVERALEANTRKSSKFESVLDSVSKEVTTVSQHVESLQKKVEVELDGLVKNADWNAFATQHKDSIAQLHQLVKDSVRHSEKSVADIKKDVDALSTTLADLSYVVNSAPPASRLHGVEASLAAIQAQLSTINSDSKSEYTVGIKSVEAALKVLSDRLSSVEASQIEVPDKLKSQVLAAINEYLPTLMAAKINPTTGQVEIAPAFWQAMEAKFALKSALETERAAASKDINTAPSIVVEHVIPSLEDFLKVNQAELEELIHARVDAKLPGAIVTKSEVLNLIERELSNVRLNNSASGSKASGRITSTPITSSDASNDADIPNIVSSIVTRMLSQHHADVIGRPDYALLSSGARVISDLSSDEYALSPRTVPTWVLSKLFGIQNYVGKPRRMALMPETHAGACFAFKGSSGTLGVALARDIYPTSFSIDHLHPELAFGPGASDLKSAPKSVELYAIYQTGFTPSQKNLAKASSITPSSLISSNSKQSPPAAVLLSNGVFTPRKPSPQTFGISQEMVEALKASQLRVRHVLVRIVDNWGNTDWTCLYRIRVHGEE